MSIGRLKALLHQFLTILREIDQRQSEHSPHCTCCYCEVYVALREAVNELDFEEKPKGLNRNASN